MVIRQLFNDVVVMFRCSVGVMITSAVKRLMFSDVTAMCWCIGAVMETKCFSKHDGFCRHRCFIKKFDPLVKKIKTELLYDSILRLAD